MAKIGRNEDFGDGNIAHAGVRKLVGDQLIELLTHIFGDSLGPMGSHNCILAKVKFLLALAVAGISWAQPVGVYSDLAEIDLTGKVTAPETPREILSPALVRNGFTSFQVVIQAPAEAIWWLFVGQNPESSVKVTMYRESEGGMLEPVELPRRSSGTEVFWMDVWTDRGAPVQRVKIEPELYLNDDWVTYPIEARLMEARVPDDSKPAKPVCPLETTGEITKTAQLRLRNATQDGALAQRVPDAELTRLRGFCDGGASPKWTEQYLRIRDYLYRLR